MNILIINFEYPPLGGGGGVATRDFAEQLAKRHQVHVITTAFTDLPRFEERGGVKIHRVPVLGRTKLPTASMLSLITFVPAALLAGLRVCRQVPFDVINAQFVVPSGIPAAALARFFSIPFVVSFIGGDIYDPSKGVSPHRFNLLRLIIRAIARRAVAGTAISSDTKRRAQDLHGVTLPITVTPLGVAPTPIAERSRAQLQLPPDVPVAVTVGRLIPRKGYEQLLRIWPQVPRAHLVIIGDGPLLGALQQQCRELKLTDRVHLVGYVSEAHKMSLLKAADVYISASTHEGFGIVFLEAMHAGLAIVATNNGGQTDFLRDGHNALLVPPDNDEELRRATLRLLTDEDLRQALSRTNREEVVQFYIGETCHKFEAVLHAAAGNQAYENPA